MRFANPRTRHFGPALRVLCSTLLLAVALSCLPQIGSGPAAAQQGNYGINPGDTLRIEVLEDPSLNRSVLVAPDGRITVPQAGSVLAGGRSVDAVQSELTQLLAGGFAATPNVFVSLESLAPRLPATPSGPEVIPTIGIYVVGEAARPGRIDVEPGTTVLQLFGVMGGFSQFAATKRIQLRRTDPQTRVETVYPLNYPAIEAGRSGNGGAVLMEGDVIVVPQRRLFE